MRFARRVSGDLEANRLTRALEARRAAGARILDLTESNPTHAGFAHPPEVLTALAAPSGVVYEPEPLGLPAARRAVAREVSRRGVDVDPARVILTASTSEAYSYLFKLLCDPGDDVLVPMPSYPLFEHLARLDAVRPVAYPMEFHGAWTIAVDAIARAATPSTRAVLVVSPNNPTGSYLKRDELAALEAFCRERAIPLVADEVFFDYPLETSPSSRAGVLEAREALTFSLGGLSKSAALPQVKLGWLIGGGPAPEVDRAVARLEIVADTYLSVSTPVQLAAESLLSAGARLRPAIGRRLSANLAVLRQVAEAHPSCRVLPVEGGWSAVVQVPATRSEEELVLQLLERDEVLVHPGYFFDFPREAFVVLSLLVPPAEFETGATRVLARAASWVE
jgi:aspartate/methionine/tyrosine aminotransferase